MYYFKGNKSNGSLVIVKRAFQVNLWNSCTRLEKIEAFQSHGQKAVNTICLGKIDQNIFLVCNWPLQLFYWELPLLKLHNNHLHFFDYVFDFKRATDISYWYIKRSEKYNTLLWELIQEKYDEKSIFVLGWLLMRNTFVSIIISL